jgi:glucokinase
VSVDAAERPLFVGVDLGGTSIKIGLIDNQGRTITYRQTPTLAEEGPEAGAQRMGEAALAVVAEAGLSPADVGRIGLATPGTMDIPAGMLLEPLNLPGWRDFPIRDRVRHHAADLPVTYANDANAACYGEYWCGTGAKFHSMVMLTLGTGVGGGIIIGDMLINGEHSSGSECGHIIIDSSPQARWCHFGAGHLEAYASATAVVARTKELLEAGRKSTLVDCVAAGEEITPILVGREAERGDPLAMSIVSETARYLGIGIVSLIHVIDPNGVVLGGAMNFGGEATKLGRRFLAEVRETVQERGLAAATRDLQIEYASLGSDAGYVGAAGLARLDYPNQ